MITRRALGDDRGAVTVEAALALCSLMLVLALAMAAVASVAAQLRCMDAAREAVRLASRGESARARSQAAAIAPAGARIELTPDGDEITVTVSSRLVRAFPGLVVSGRAVGVLEPGVLGSMEANGTDGDLDATDPAARDTRGDDESGGGSPADDGQGRAR